MPPIEGEEYAASEEVVEGRRLFAVALMGDVVVDAVAQEEVEEEKEGEDRDEEDEDE